MHVSCLFLNVLEGAQTARRSAAVAGEEKRKKLLECEGKRAHRRAAVFRLEMEDGHSLSDSSVSSSPAYSPASPIRPVGAGGSSSIEDAIGDFLVTLRNEEAKPKAASSSGGDDAAMGAFDERPAKMARKEADLFMSSEKKLRAHIVDHAQANGVEKANAYQWIVVGVLDNDAAVYKL